MGFPALFFLFLRFGLLAFGGPVAQIAMIRRALVDERRWIDPEGFHRLLAIMQALPGPEAHELCVHLGIRAKGRLGGLLAGLGFMAPGLLLMLVLAALYTRFASAGSWLQALSVEVQAAVLAVIATALRRLAGPVLVDARAWLLALAAAGATLAGLPFWITLPLAGAIAAGRRSPLVLMLLAFLAAAGALLEAAGATDLPTTMQRVAASDWPLFLTGLKAGLLTFGGAYAAVPFVREDMVGRGWVSDAQFLDGLALTTFLPSPLILFATFAGFIAGGLSGALAITAGIFLPAFAIPLLFYERLEALADSPRLRQAFAGIIAAVIGLIAVTFLDLARTAAATTPDPAASLLVFAAALLALRRWPNPLAVPLVLGAAALAGLAFAG
jgi:chromate transporter